MLIVRPLHRYRFSGALPLTAFVLRTWSQRSYPSSFPAIALEMESVVGVEAAEEALADVGEALARHAHVPLAHAQRLHQQLGGVLQVLHRNLNGEITVSW